MIVVVSPTFIVGTFIVGAITGMGIAYVMWRDLFK